MKIRIATRGSDLALAQARFLAARIEERLGGVTEIQTYKTTGDRLLDVRLADVGGKGLFVKEIEEALLAGKADVAIHSAKDLPGALADGLALVAFPDRADPRDALVARERGASLESLPAGARVGTGSVRRAAQIRALRRDLEIVPIRGNVPTRIAKLEREGLDAVVLACAGLERLGLAERIDERIAPEVMLPAVAQGILALEARADDPLARELARLDDPAASLAAAAERAFLERLGGDCHVPLAAHAEPEAEGRLRLRGLVAAEEGEIVRGAETCPVAEAREAGRRAAEAVLAGGGDRILAALGAGGAG